MADPIDTGVNGLTSVSIDAPAASARGEVKGKQARVRFCAVPRSTE